jgi:hypothetical protein
MRTHQRTFTSMPLARRLALVLVLGCALPAQAVEPHYFVAVDSLRTLTSGTYAGLPNPNYGRLTFLFAHPSEEAPSSSHFHAIGAYSYTGPVESPTVITTNTNNRIPELSTGNLPLRLLPDTGVFAGRLASRPTGEEYSDLRLASIQVLRGFPGDSIEGFLFHSSEGRWTAPLTCTSPRQRGRSSLPRGSTPWVQGTRSASPRSTGPRARRPSARTRRPSSWLTSAPGPCAWGSLAGSHLTSASRPLGISMVTTMRTSMTSSSS